LTFPEGQGDLAVAVVSEAINYEQILVADVRLDHRVAARTCEERTGGRRRLLEYGVLVMGDDDLTVS
jgi:hypothetical protein